MENSNDPKTYELAYHINPDLEKADVNVQMQELNSLLIKNGASIFIAREPKRIHLSYPIKNKQYAHFGIFDFTAPAETIEKISAEIKLQNNIIRYLLLKRPDESKELRILGEHRRPRMSKTHEPAAEVVKKPAKEKTKEETEQLEKDIEKAIEGL